jgi:hypothetical protein
MLADVEEKITTKDIDPMTKQETVKVSKERLTAVSRSRRRTTL